MQDPGADHCGYDIRKDAGRISEGMGQIAEDYLIHPVVRTDVKHVDLSKRVEQIVASRGDQAADEVKPHSVQISTERKIRCIRTVGEDQPVFG